MSAARRGWLYAVQKLTGAAPAPEDDRVLPAARLLQPRAAAAPAEGRGRRGGASPAGRAAGARARAAAAGGGRAGRGAAGVPRRLPAGVPPPPRAQAAAVAARAARARRPVLGLRLGPAAAGAAHRRQADQDGRVGRRRPLRRGVARALARGARRRQGVLHHRGGVLVPRDRDLPDGADAARQHPRVHRRRHQGHRLVDADAAHHRVPRARVAARPPARRDAGRPRAAAAGALGGRRPRAPAHGHLRHAREARHRAPRHQVQEHPREAERHVRDRRLRARRAVRGRAGRGRHRAEHARRHAPLHGARGARRHARRGRLRRVQDGRRVLAGARAVGDGAALRRRRRGRAGGGALPRRRAGRPQLRRHARRRGGARAAAGAAAALAPRRAAGGAGRAVRRVLARLAARAAHGAARQEVAGQAHGRRQRQAAVTPRGPDIYFVYFVTRPFRLNLSIVKFIGPRGPARVSVRPGFPPRPSGGRGTDVRSSL